MKREFYTNAVDGLGYLVTKLENDQVKLTLGDRVGLESTAWFERGSISRLARYLMSAAEEWTTQTPDREGYYWYKRHPRNRGMLVYINQCYHDRDFAWMVQTMFEAPEPISEWGEGLWYGPLSPP